MLARYGKGVFDNHETPVQNTNVRIGDKGSFEPGSHPGQSIKSTGIETGQSVPRTIKRNAISFLECALKMRIIGRTSHGRDARAADIQIVRSGNR